MIPVRHALICLALAGCASPGDQQKLGVLTVALAGERVFVGRAIPFRDTGTFEIETIDEPSVVCAGRYRYDPDFSGRARFACDNSMAGALRITAEGAYVGSAEGVTDLGDTQVLFGYSLQQVNNKLSFPGGKALVVTSAGYQLR